MSQILVGPYETARAFAALGAGENRRAEEHARAAIVGADKRAASPLALVGLAFAEGGTWRARSRALYATIASAGTAHAASTAVIAR